MPVFTLSAKVLGGAMQGAKNVYPLEFIALFSRENGKDVLVIPPFSHYGPSESSFSEWHLPPMDIIGSFHSHPTGRGSASLQDEFFFSKFGGFHLVAFPPFSISSFKAFTSQGKPAQVQLV